MWRTYTKSARSIWLINIHEPRGAILSELGQYIVPPYRPNDIMPTQKRVKRGKDLALKEAAQSCGTLDSFLR